MKYKSLMKKIANRTKIEHLFLKYFKKEIDAIELYDKVQEILEGKNISDNEVAFIREYLRKEYEETEIL